MPRRAATARASSMSSGLQQLPQRAAPEYDHTRRVMPRTSCPCSTSSAAAADESTPPLMATTTRIGALSPNTLPPRPPPGTPRVSNTSTAENALQGFGGVQRGVVEHGLQQRPGGRTDGRRGTDAQHPHHVRTAQGEVRRAEGRPGGKHLTHPRRELALG